MANVSVYFGDDVYRKLSDRAERDGDSFSKCVSKIIVPVLMGKDDSGGQLDRIESKLDKILKGHWTPKEKKISKVKDAVRSDDEILAEAQKKLDKAKFKHKDMTVDVPVETPEQKYKRLNPKKRCLKCQRFNRDCECDAV